MVSAMVKTIFAQPDQEVERRQLAVGANNLRQRTSGPWRSLLGTEAVAFDRAGGAVE